MINYASDDQLVRELAADLTPVSHLASPLVRILIWLALVVGIAAGLAESQDLQPLLRQFAGSFDLCASAFGSLLTAVLAGVAAFQLSLPDRKPGWVLLPLPAAAVWIGASATDCLRSWTVISAKSLALGILAGQTTACSSFWAYRCHCRSFSFSCCDPAIRFDPISRR